MAFSAEELRVLRRALAQALQPSIRTGNTSGDVQDFLRLADAVQEAALEGGRLRTFRSAELARYRAALPGSAIGYLERLRGALESGYVPQPDDLAALRSLCAQPCTPAEERRRASVLRHCERIAELSVSARPECRVPTPAARPAAFGREYPRLGALAPRPRLTALPGGRAAAQEPGSDKGKGKEPEPEPEKRRQQQETEKGGNRGNDKDNDKERENQKEREQEKGTEPAPEPGRRVPTPAEVWPPRHRPTPPAAEPRRPRKPAPPPEQRRGA
jgi:hypothetical protein